MMSVQMKGLVLTLLVALVVPAVARQSIAPGHFAAKLEEAEANKKVDDPSISKKTKSLVGDLLSATAGDKEEEPEAAKQARKVADAAKAAIGKAAAQSVVADKVATDKAATEKAVAEKAAAENVAAEKAAALKAAALKAAAFKAAAEKAAVEKAAAKAAAVKADAERAAAKKAAAEKEAADKAAFDKAAAQKVAAEKAAAKTAVVVSKAETVKEGATETNNVVKAKAKAATVVDAAAAPAAAPAGAEGAGGASVYKGDPAAAGKLTAAGALAPKSPTGAIPGGSYNFDKPPTQLASQGFAGNPVQHQDKSTMTVDFGHEYGPDCWAGMCNGPKKKLRPAKSAASFSRIATVLPVALIVAGLSC